MFAANANPSFETTIDNSLEEKQLLYPDDYLVHVNGEHVAQNLKVL